MEPAPLTHLPADWEPTRATLRGYAHAVGSVARVHAIPHPKWWHISLRLAPTGLATVPMPMAPGGQFWIRLDINAGRAVIETSSGDSREVALDAGLSGSAFGDALYSELVDLGISGDYDRTRFESDEPGEFNASDAAAYFTALVNIATNLEAHRAELGDEVGPVQIWPHGFDIAFEWFGAGDSQINLGFYPAGRAYFYSNPWPFDKTLVESSLSEPASWHSDGWEGSILYYDDLMATADPAATLMRYSKEVFELASPGLLTP